MAKIALVTDSSSDLTEDMQEEFAANIIKQKVYFGEQDYSKDCCTAQFFFRQLTCPESPTTQPAELGDFVSLYKALLKNHEEIISIHLSELLSKHLSLARQAREILGAEQRIHLVNSGSVSIGAALQVAEAARGIKEGQGTKDILDNLERARANTDTLLMLDTLNFLRRSGRNCLLKGFLASMINAKPIARVNPEGGFDSIGRARDHDQGIAFMVRCFREKAAGRQVVSSGIVHGAARDYAVKLKHALEYAFCVEVNFFLEVGPIVGAYSGPGMIGAALTFA